MRLQSQADIGAACVSAFVVGSAFRDVYLGDIFRSVNIFLVLLIAFGIAAIAGLAIARAKGESLKTVLRSPRDTILMNLATAGAWICYFLALKWLEPSIVNTLFAGVGPFVVIALNGCGLAIAAPHPTTPLQRTLQLGIVVSLAALVLIVAAGRSGLAGIQSRDALAGAGLALLSGALITVGHLYAKRLNEAGASPHAIMGTRFIALLFVAVTAIAQAGPAAVLVPVPELARIAAAATLLIVVPDRKSVV